MQPEQIPVNQYNGNNSDTTFDFDFFIENSNQLKVTLTDYDGTQTVLTHNVDYTIHEVGNKYGSYITYPYVTEQYQSTHDVLGYDATTEQAQMLTLELVIPIEQPSEYTNSNTLAIKNIEKSLDYGIRVDQMLDAKINRLDSNQSDFESNIIEEMNDFMVEESVARQTFESTMQQAQSDFETTIVGRQTELENTVSSTLSTQNQQIQTLTSDTESSLETMNAQLTTMSENMTNFENSITAQETSHQTAVSEYLEDITAAKNEISGDYNSFKEEVNSAIEGKADESDLSNVAYSGSYNDLSNKPNIPTVDQSYDGTSDNAQSGTAIEGELNKKISYTNLGNIDCQGDVLAYCRENLTDTGYYSFHDVGDGYDWFVSTQNNEREGLYSIFQFIWGETEDITIQYSYDNGSEWFDYSYAKRSDLARVATSGSYNDLSDKPSIPSAQVQSDWNQSDNTAVDYIKNKPTIPAAQIQSDWNQTNTSAKDYIKNKPTIPSGVVVDQTYNASSANAQSGVAIAEALANYVESSDLSTVATSGSYNDLSNKPTIPAAQIQSDWNQSDNSVADYIKNKPTLGTMAAENKNDYTKTSGLSTVATSGSYNDLSNKPTIPAAQIQSDWTQTDNTKKDYIKNKPNLSTVATSGNYNDLSNKPTIPTVPTALSGFVDDLGSNPIHTHSQYLTSHQDISGKQNKVTISYED